MGGCKLDVLSLLLQQAGIRSGLELRADRELVVPLTWRMYKSLRNVDSQSQSALLY